MAGSLVSRRRDALATAATAFLGANLLHGVDHLRQHMAGLDVQVKIGGALITAAAVAVFVLVRRRHPSAPTAATVVGLLSAVLVAQSHLASHWSSFSDSYIDDIHPDVASWIIVAGEVLAALTLGCVGAHRLLRAPFGNGGEGPSFLIRQINPDGDAVVAGGSWDYADAFEVVLDHPDDQPAEAWLRTAVGSSTASERRLVSAVHRHVLGFALNREPNVFLGWQLLTSEHDVAAVTADSRLLRAVLVVRRHTPTRSVASTYLFFHESARARLLWLIVRPIHLRVARKLLSRAARAATEAQENTDPPTLAPAHRQSSPQRPRTREIATRQGVPVKSTRLR